MTKHITSIFVGGVLGAIFAFGAQATPLSPAPTQKTQSDITLVAGGCGIGWHREPYG